MHNKILQGSRAGIEATYVLTKDLWTQLVCDVVSEILYDKKFMGSRVLTPDRVLTFNKEIERRLEYYRAALGTNLDEDADVKRSQLDASMKQLVDDYNRMMEAANNPERFPMLPFIPFEERYQGVAHIVYDKPVREPKHPSVKRRGKRKKKK